jgi:hypothetical protein
MKPLPRDLAFKASTAGIDGKTTTGRLWGAVRHPSDIRDTRVKSDF